jgi:hypothetical protein
MGKVGDTDGFTHIKHKDLTTFAKKTGLNDEPSGFWNRHEVPLNIWVGYRNRPTFKNLLSENGHNAAS